MSRPLIKKITDRYPIGIKVIYNNHGKKGHGNLAKVSDILVGISTPEKVAAVQLTFDSGGNHYVSPKQLQTYYSPIEPTTQNQSKL